MKQFLLSYVLLFFFAAAISQTAPVSGQWKFKLEDNPEFKKADFNDADWMPVTVPNGWTKLGVNKERTTGWYRVSFSVPDNLLNQDIIFFAGAIDDADETYFNGALVGATGKFPPGDQTAWDTERTYSISKKLVKKNNVIAIRVYNGIGDGGIYSGRILLKAKKEYERQVAAQLRSKKSYYQLTTSNGLIAAVYNEQTQAIENFFPHIFSYYDSGLLVKPVLSNIKPLLNVKPISTKYLQNTHVIEVKYPAFSIFYYASFTRQDKILYAVVRGKEAAVSKIDFTYAKITGQSTVLSSIKKNGHLTEKYFVFGFSDTLNTLPDMDLALQQAPSPEGEVLHMRQLIASCKIPAGISAAERNVMEQGITVLKMSQVSEKEIFPFAKGQVMASLRPGVWAICWVRDGAFAIEAMSKLGMYAEAKKALEFMLNAKPTDQYVHYIHTDGKDYGLGVPYIISLTRYFGNGREESDYTGEGGPNIEIDDLGLFLTALYHYVNESGDKAFFEKWTKKYGSSVMPSAIIPMKKILSAGQWPMGTSFARKRIYVDQRHLCKRTAADSSTAEKIWYGIPGF